MNKKRVDALLPAAFDVLKDPDTGISDGVNIPGSFRGQISSFGASVCTGSLLSAIAFFSQQGGAAVARQQLITAIYKVIRNNGAAPAVPGGNLFEFVRLHPDKKAAKELVLDAAIAIKLAINLFNLDETQTDENKDNAAAE